MSEKRNLTLPTDSAERKEYPLLSGFLKYFPAAVAGVANLSKIGNDKHNPGQPLHHARGKSTDHGDCIVRHLMDVEDLIAAKARGVLITEEQILLEASSLVWRALAYSQELHERYGAPLAPSAKVEEEVKQAVPEFNQPSLIIPTQIAEEIREFVSKGELPSWVMENCDCDLCTYAKKSLEARRA